jgi:HlyD family secretion protein
MIGEEDRLFAPLQGCIKVKKWWLVLLLAAVLGTGLYFWWGLTGVQPLHEKSLKFAEVCRMTMRETVSATGRVEPREIVQVCSELSGSVLCISKGIGDTVFEGTGLARLDDRRLVLKLEEANTLIKTAEAAFLQAEAALAQAEASKDAADRHLQTQQALEKAGGFRTERDQAEAQLQTALAGIKVAKTGVEVVRAKKLAAQTALKEAELLRDLSRIKVPGPSRRSAGPAKREFLILDRKVYEGQMVGPQTGPLFTLAGSLNIVEVSAQVVEGDVNKIREGLSAIFKIPDYDDEDSEFAGEITRIRPQSTIVKGAVYYDAVIQVKNRKDPKTNEWQLRPGMTASIDIIRLEHKNVWRVPSGALNFTLEEAYQSEAARARVAEWKKRSDATDWRTLWIWDASTHLPSPIFVRIGASKGEIALKDSEGNEILEWEPGKEPTGPLRVITDVPPVRPPGFFDKPAPVKL